MGETCAPVTHVCHTRVDSGRGAQLACCAAVWPYDAPVATPAAAGAGHESAGARAGTVLLVTLLLLLPFEPRAPVARVLGLSFTVLELAAAVVGAALLWLGRRRALGLLRRPTLPLLMVTAFALAHVVAAAMATAHRGESARFALRMCALAAFAWIFATAGRRARHAGPAGLAVAGATVALLSTLESAGLAPSRFLDLFREMRFTVGGAPRASAGTAYPTLAAAWIGWGLVAAVALAGLRRRGPALAAAAAALLAPGLLFTYSRGAVIATGAGLLVLALVAWRAGARRAAGASVAALAVLGCAFTVFAQRAEIFRLRLATEGSGSFYGALYEPALSALQMAPLETHDTEVQVVNVGRKAWKSEEGFALSYHWFDPKRHRLSDGRRTPLAGELRPGEGARVAASVQAPAEPGCYLLVWDMVHENVTWFSGQGVAPAAVPARVGAGELAECGAAVGPLASLAWHPSRFELWRLALAMWRDRPLVGVGSDNFRRLYGRYAGRPFWDARVTANNLFLEVGATTGGLGVIALGGLLAATAGSAARRAQAVWTPAAAHAAALLALITAMAVHGAVDYLLGFTGPYLLLAFVAGSAGARE